MTREINFGDQVLTNVLNVEKQILGMGAFAHKGESGHYYKIGQAVRRGQLVVDYGPGTSDGNGAMEEAGMTKPRHTHKRLSFSKDGVRVFTEPTTDIDRSGKIVH